MSEDLLTSASYSEAEDQLLDVRAVCMLLGGSKPIDPATVWRNVKAGRIPPPIAIAPNIRRWRLSELRQMVRERALQRETDLAGHSAEAVRRARRRREPSLRGPDAEA